MLIEPLLAVLPYPEIDPVIVELGPLALRWYGLAYVVGLLLGWRYMHVMNRRYAEIMQTRDIDDLLFWMTLGVVLGGRLGSVLFYNFEQYIDDPLAVLAIWQGGMSFHGGLLGVIVAEVLFARRRGIPLLPLADLVAVAVPIGLFFGRIANFVNGELYGRPTDVAWAMVFPHSDGQPRHPSQLYEAALEGVLLFVVLFLLARRPGGFSRPGFLTGVFLIGYGLSRILVELAREPDAVPGYLFGGTTMGQWLSVPMLLGGAWLLWHARHAPAPQPK